MILADTSVWIEHLRHGEPAASDLLAEGQMLMHPYVLGEIALGSMRDWNRVIYRLTLLPAAKPAGDLAVIDMIEAHRLQGSGIGYIDAHLLAACLLGNRTYLWTRDRRLGAIAARLGVEAGAA